MALDNTILVTDDEKGIRELFEDILTMAGYTVKTADSAEQALDILRDQKILVMFSDLDLPAMNGYDLCKKIREKNPIAVIYAITGYSTIFDVFDSRAAGFDDFFIKPVSREKILAAAREAFEKLERWNVLPYASKD